MKEDDILKIYIFEFVNDTPNISNNRNVGSYVES